MTFHQFCKQASYATYNYTASAKRNYTPPPVGYKPRVVNDDDKYSYRSTKVNMPKPAPKELQNGTNKYTTKDTEVQWSRLRGFENTVSGTGFGRPYWNYPTNPFEN